MKCGNMGKFWILEWEPVPGGKSEVKVFASRKDRQAFIRDNNIQMPEGAELPDDLDLLAIDWVVIERIPMRLTGNDRIEAIRRLTLKGLRAMDIGALLFIDGSTVSSLQANNGITPAGRPPRDPLSSPVRKTKIRESV
jgi:hypothetical protein